MKKLEQIIGDAINVGIDFQLLRNFASIKKRFMRINDNNSTSH